MREATRVVMVGDVTTLFVISHVSMTWLDDDG